MTRWSGAAAAMLVLLGGCTTAPAPRTLVDGRAALPPAGWLDYCRRSPADPSCRVVPLDTARRAELEGAALAIARLPRREDQARFGQAERWAVADRQGGDCEDLALAARAQLLARGWPSAAVRLATTLTERGASHVVLTVDVEDNAGRETLVIDGRVPGVQPLWRLRALGYRFLTRQAPSGPGWVQIGA